MHLAVALVIQDVDEPAKNVSGIIEVFFFFRFQISEDVQSAVKMNKKCLVLRITLLTKRPFDRSRNTTDMARPTVSIYKRNGTMCRLGLCVGIYQR